MHVSVKWFDGKYPSFNINLAKAEGQEEFLSIKGCRIANGNKGPFVSMPSTKNEHSGKYWNHAWGSEAFMAHVLKVAQESQPQQQDTQPPPNDISDDIPF